MILGIDPGNSETKVCMGQKVTKFPSVLGEYRELTLTNELGPNDFIWEYLGSKGFGGTLAEAESEFAGAMQGSTKAHRDTLLRVLLALHKVCDSGKIQLVVGQPIAEHNETEKLKIKSLLMGLHDIKVNDFRKVFNITDVTVAAEGAAASLCIPHNNFKVIRLLDIGSGTVNAATLKDKRYIDKDSFSLGFGAGTVKSLDLEAMARAITTKAHKWSRQDPVYLIGGLAEQIQPYIKSYYPNAQILYPNGEHPVYANVVGFYKIGVAVYPPRSAYEKY